MAEATPSTLSKDEKIHPSFFLENEEYLPCFGFTSRLPFFMITVFFFMNADEKQKKEYFVYFHISEFLDDPNEHRLNPLQKMQLRRKIASVDFLDASESIYQSMFKLQRIFQTIPTALNLVIKNLTEGKPATTYMDLFVEKLFLLFRNDSELGHFSKKFDKMLLIFFPDIYHLYEACNSYRTHEFLFIVHHVFFPHLEIVNEILRFYLEIGYDQLKMLAQQKSLLSEFHELARKIRAKAHERQGSPQKYFESLMQFSSISSIGYDFFDDDDYDNE